jgi:ribose transport system substrate-binding protein
LARRGTWALASLSALVVVAACSSSGQGSTPSNGTPGGATSASSSGSAVSATSASAALAPLYAGTYHAPSGARVAAATGKHIAVISCGQSLTSCAASSNAAMDAAKAIGWQATLYDGKLTPAGLEQSLTEAIAQKVAGIVVTGFDCDFAPAGFAQAKQAHIPVVDAFGNPVCGNGQTGYTGLYLSGYPTGIGFLEGWSRAKADYLIDKFGSRVNVLDFDLPDVPVVHQAQLAFATEIKKRCPACTVSEVPFTPAQFGPALQQIAQEAVLQHPGANAVTFETDGDWLAGIGAGLQASGQLSKLNIIAAEGDTAVLPLIGKDGHSFAEMPYSLPWAGWAMIDTLNSLLNGKQPRDSGLGWQLIDAAHPPKTDPGGTYEPPVDFKSDYLKLWGK